MVPIIEPSREDPPIRIRTAGSTDNTLLAELGARTFFNTFADANSAEDMAAYLAASFSPQIQAAELADPANTFLIADVDGAAAGFAHLRFGPAPLARGGTRPLEIARIYADTAWIGRGVGSALMAAALEFAANHGCDICWLGVWEQNPRAIAFYKKWDFAIAGTQIFKLGQDQQVDYVMVRDVTRKA